MTDRYGVIGHPISHSKSPVIHAQFARQTGQDLTYEAIDVAPDALTESLDNLIREGFKGLNVFIIGRRPSTRRCVKMTETATFSISRVPYW